MSANAESSTSLERDWWLRLVLVLQSPVNVFSWLRDDSADATGAQLCGNPESLASALLRLESGAQAMPMQVNQATEPVYIVKPFSGGGFAYLAWRGEVPAGFILARDLGGGDLVELGRSHDARQGLGRRLQREQDHEDGDEHGEEPGAVDAKVDHVISVMPWRVSDANYPLGEPDRACGG